MALRDYMQDLMRSQNVSEVNIIPDISISSLPGDHSNFVVDHGGLEHSIHHITLEPLQECSGHDSNASLEYFTRQDEKHLDMDEVLVQETPRRNRLKGRFINNNGREEEWGRMLTGFRERHRRLKQSLSPLRVYKLSPKNNSGQTTPTTMGNSSYGMHGNNQRSRLAMVATTTEISGPPSLTDL